MPKIRTIKPEFWEDEKIAELPLGCRLLFIGCWNFADDQGVVRASPVILKSRIFPYDASLRTAEIKQWLDMLENSRILIPFVYENESYYVVRTFSTHQRIDKRYFRCIVPVKFVNAVLEAEAHHVDTQQEVEVEVEKEVEGKKLSEESEKSPLSPSENLSGGSESFRNFCEWINRKAPNVSRLQYPFTEAEYRRLKEDYPRSLIQEVIEEMHNHKGLLKRYVSANLTFRRWVKVKE